MANTVSAKKAARKIVRRTETFDAELQVLHPGSHDIPQQRLRGFKSKSIRN